MRLRTGGLALLALGALGCGGTTGGHLIQMPFQAGGIARDATQPFTIPMTGQGWKVTLTEAKVVLGPLYFNIDAPSSASFRSGVVIVQATEQFIVDLLDPTLQNVPGGANGETGAAFSVEIGFYTTVNNYNDMAVVGADGGAIKTLPVPLAANGQQGTAYLAGEATKEGAVVDFAGRVQITGALVTQGTPIDFLSTLSGVCANWSTASRMCEGALEFTTTSGPLQLRVNPSTWFDQANFCNIVRPPPVRVAGDGGATDAGPTVVSAGDGGVDAGSPPVGAPCAPTAGTVYDWADTNPFNSAVLGEGMKNSDAVYLFSLGGQ